MGLPMYRDGAAAARIRRRRSDVARKLLVNVTPRETRVAVVENGMLQELHIERGSQRGVVGNIYKGKVQRVMPGMQAAFVDIGPGSRGLPARQRHVPRSQLVRARSTTPPADAADAGADPDHRIAARRRRRSWCRWSRIRSAARARG